MAYYKFMTAVLCGLFCSSRGETSDCSAGWFYDLHCYQVQLGRSDWTTAQSNCRDRKANLASIHSEMEDVLIWSQLPRGRKFWIGLSRFESTTMPSWADSSSVVFTYWAKNEPNRLNKTCTYIQPEDGKWKAIECDAKLLVDGYICKRPLDILLSPLSVNNSHGCLLGSYAYDRICYTWYNETRSWDDAQKLCQMLNGSLATVPDKYVQLIFCGSMVLKWRCVLTSEQKRARDRLLVIGGAQLRIATDTPKPYHGLDLIVDMFSSDLGGRYIAGKIAVLIMTKLSDIPEYTKNSAKRLQEQGVAILIVAVGQEVRSEPVILNSDKKDFFLVEKLNDLWRVKNKITSRICEGRLELR
ncbi:hypothetical protein Btru_055612 [Bulinus truncatus]|nr:hypothetical protein Btru_055612 [Bulinus truncatus]